MNLEKLVWQRKKRKGRKMKMENKEIKKKILILFAYPAPISATNLTSHQMKYLLSGCQAKQRAKGSFMENKDLILLMSFCVSCSASQE